MRRRRQTKHFRTCQQEIDNARRNPFRFLFTFCWLPCWGRLPRGHFDATQAVATWHTRTSVNGCLLAVRLEWMENYTTQSHLGSGQLKSIKLSTTQTTFFLGTDIFHSGSENFAQHSLLCKQKHATARRRQQSRACFVYNHRVENSSGFHHRPSNPSKTAQIGRPRERFHRPPLQHTPTHRKWYRWHRGRRLAQRKKRLFRPIPRLRSHTHCTAAKKGAIKSNQTRTRATSPTDFSTHEYRQKEWQPALSKCDWRRTALKKKKKQN